MKRILTSIALLFLFIATSSAETELSLPANIKPFFIHRTVENVWGEKTHSGVYCYALDGKGARGSFVEIYIVNYGKVTETVSQGWLGKELMEKIRKISLKPFDYKAEVKKTIVNLKEEYRKKGISYHPPSVLDGCMYDIIYNLDGVRLEIHAHEPGYTIYRLAEHNENIGKLYKVYRELMLYYAERKFSFK